VDIIQETLLKNNFMDIFAKKDFAKKEKEY